jgi:uncharacterized protein YnzC (UPF0291/DUF896 family)
MAQQYNKVEKRIRRRAYLDRLKAKVRVKIKAAAKKK